MNNVVALFEDGKTEIESYFGFISLIDHDASAIIFTDDNSKKNIHPNLKVILLANTFLLLYNLIEATVRNSLLAIYSRISDENIQFDDLSDNLKCMWVELAKKRLVSR